MSEESAQHQRLRITEIFHSLQGEARDVGRPTVFVRLTGCPLRCVWCDTEYAFHGGQWRDIDEIVERLENDLSSSEIFAALFELELAGKVRQMPGKNFVKSF